MRNIIVFQLARFGDIIQTKRLLLSLAAQEHTQIHLCVDPSMAALARMVYPFAIVHELPAHKTDINQTDLLSLAASTFAALRDINFDEVYILNYSPLAFACASMFPEETVYGYARSKGQDMRSPLARLSFNLLQDRRFSPINLVDLWAHFCDNPLAPEKVNPIPKSANTHRIGIVMAGRESRRSLPPAVLAACVQAIFQARGGPELVCIGSRSESVLVRRLMRELPPRTAEKIVDLTGKTALTDLPEVLQGLDLVLTPDTGAMHLCAHLGVPVQAFFLSSAWCYETGPYGFGHKVWQALEPCSPCLESAACPYDTRCLKAFSHPGFLSHLSGKIGDEWPDGLLGCTSMLDDLGVTYKAVDGGDPYMDARKELRSGFLEYRGAKSPQMPPMRPELAEFLFHERDWMLPADWQNKS